MVEEHSHALWCIAAAILGDRDRARDTVQDAAIIGLGRRAEFVQGTSFASWMGQIVRYTALNEARRARTRRAAGDEAIAGVSRREAPAERSPVSRFGELTADQESFDDATRDALKQLDETARACLLMRTVLDMPYERIADTLGIPMGTAMSHVHRSRQRLRSLLTEGPTSPRPGPVTAQGGRA